LASATGGLEIADGEPFTVQQVVVDGGGDPVRWALRVHDGRVAVEAGAVTDPDVTLTTDRATATALARGELAITDAFMAGRLRVAGDLRTLMRAGAVLGALDEAFAAVRARTDWG
ncbi:MAG TPA: SCP2 sterol-binding domain-containing protein, partial [Acidimicrobiales bacterium]|nr:SCP2 sterol-binding domain-containing protein [Acidimicrobiales bacterium]